MILSLRPKMRLAERPRVINTFHFGSRYRGKGRPSLSGLWIKVSCSICPLKLIKNSILCQNVTTLEMENYSFCPNSVTEKWWSQLYTKLEPELKLFLEWQPCQSSPEGYGFHQRCLFYWNAVHAKQYSMPAVNTELRTA